MAPSGTDRRGNTMRRIALWAMGTAGIWLAGCGDEVADEAGHSPEVVEKIINGRFTFDRPEVGSINMGGSFCTATLIRPNVLISAAHCVGYGTVDRPGSQVGVFSIDVDGTRTERHAVDAYVSFTRRGPSETDIALLRLRTPVPADLARPARLAPDHPTEGTRVTWFGYGCGRRNSGNDANSGKKQKLSFDLGPTNNSCPGDSGGPTVIGDDGAIFRITSGYSIPGGDIFGDVPAMYDRLQAQADAWWPDGEADPGLPEAPEAPEVPEAPAPDRPVIRSARVDKVWLYLEWTPVPGVVDYTQFVVVNDADGEVGTYLHRQDAGRTTRSGNKFNYFPLSEVCEKARAAGLGAEPLEIWAQVWPGQEDTRAENGGVDRRIDCARYR